MSKKKASSGSLLSTGIWRVLACRNSQLLAQQMLKPKKASQVQKQIAYEFSNVRLIA